MGEQAGVVAAARTVSGRAWVWREADERSALAMAQRYGLPEVVARLLAGRGIQGAEAERFLAPKLTDWLPDPAHLRDLDRAVARLVAAVENREPVGIITDYDVDGATSAALVALVLGELGVACRVLVPDRLVHGYGPHPALLARLAATGIRLVLVLDAGTTAFEPLALAREQGFEVVVVDHHSQTGPLPPALAIINPNRQDQISPVGHLAAVGVCFLLLLALLQALRARGRDNVPDLFSYLDLVALGTVCDMVPLVGLNRALVDEGLKIAARNSRVGLAALAQVAGLTALGEAQHFSFVLGPRLNAGGRLGRSELAVALLTETDPLKAASLAAELDQLNRSRQQREQQVLAEAQALLEPQLKEGAPLLFACRSGWHPGLLGIVAARLVDRFGLPVCLVAADGPLLKGSARSVPGLDIGRVVLEARARALVREGGGHPLAAGFTLDNATLRPFQRFLCEQAAAARLSARGAPPLLLDGSIVVSAVGPQLAAAIARLAPFGVGNPEPRFALLDAVPVETQIVGGHHIACLLLGGLGQGVRGIAFRAVGTPLGDRLLAGRTRLLLAGSVARDAWRGEIRVCFQIEDAALPAEAEPTPLG